MPQPQPGEKHPAGQPTPPEPLWPAPDEPAAPTGPAPVPSAADPVTPAASVDEPAPVASPTPAPLADVTSPDSATARELNGSPIASDERATAPLPAGQEPPTAPTVESSTALPKTAVEFSRWSGSAAVPPPTPKPEKRRQRGSDDEAPPASPPRGSTRELPMDEWEPPESRTPVDPWADADPVAPPLHPYPPVVSLPPTRPYPSSPAQPPPAQPPLPTPPPAQLPVPRSPAAPPTPPPAPLPPVRKPPKRARRRRQELAPPPPGWEAPPGYVPVPVRRRRRWPRIMTWLTLLSVACCCGCPGYLGKPMWEQYPASVSIQAEVADLRVRDDAKTRQTVQRLEQETRTAHLLAETTFAAVYGDPTGKRVTIFGSTGFRLDPESDLDKEMTRLTERYALTEMTPIETGVRGEHEKCGVGEADGADVVVCGWADHGSLGAALFTRRSVPDSAALLGEMRTALVTRG
ncbi:hypothetical protein [Micromonospora sp. NPDC049679]|uniref:hypothetical protein n=1 Tax=Micromonospora sp. NPDC049679 TaxID=3155920 RepID=UPI003403BB41